jgi:hypothetical protein
VIDVLRDKGLSSKTTQTPDGCPQMEKKTVKDVRAFHTNRGLLEEIICHMVYSVPTTAHL